MRYLLIALLAVSCSQSDLKSSVTTKDSADAEHELAPADSAPKIKPENPRSSDEKANAIGSGNDEFVVAPTEISGTYLSCVTLMDSKRFLNDTSIGCNLNDANGRRVDPRSLAKAFSYKFEMEADSRIKTMTRMSSVYSSAYDAYLDLSTTADLNAGEAIEKIQVKLELIGLLNGSSNEQITSPLNSVLESETSTGNNIAWSQACNNTGCEFRDGVTGLLWSAFQPATTFLDAKNFCQASSSETAKWRLPTEIELMLARANRIASNTYSATIRAQDGYAWASDAGQAYGSEVKTRMAVNPVSGMYLNADLAETSSLQFSCVRE